MVSQYHTAFGHVLYRQILAHTQLSSKLSECLENFTANCLLALIYRSLVLPMNPLKKLDKYGK